MAYMNQEKKARIAAKLKEALAGSGIKYSLAVRNHSSIVLNIKSGPVDFLSNFWEACKEQPRYARENLQKPAYIDVNPYHFKDHFSGEVRDLLEKVFAALNLGNWDNSDPMSDYFDVGHYVDVNIGRWDKPYELVAK